MSRLREVFTPKGRTDAGRRVHAWHAGLWAIRRSKGDLNVIAVTNHDPTLVVHDDAGNKSITRGRDWALNNAGVTKVKDATTYDQIPSAMLLDEVTHPERIKDPSTEQHFNVIKANWERFVANPDQAVTVWSGLYLNTINNDDENAYRILEQARQMPERPLLAFDYPNMGDSDPLTDSQKSTKKKDSYFEIADAQLRIMQTQGVKKINLIGSSMGAFASVALAVRAAHFGIIVENLVIIEAVGGKHMMAPLLGLRVAAEGEKLDLYHSSPADPAMEVSHNKFSPGKALHDWLSRDPWFVYLRSMSKNTMLDRLADSFVAQENMKVLFVNGSESKVSPVKTINKIVKNLQQRFGKERVQQVIFSGEGHLTNVHPKILASLVKSQLDGSFM